MERADADASAQQASLGKSELPLTVYKAKSDAKRSVMIRQLPFKANLTKREDWFGEPYT